MNRRNLIPAKHQSAMARAARVRVWSFVLSTELLLIGTLAAAIWFCQTDSQVPSGQLDRAEADSVKQTELVKHIQTELAAARQAQTDGRQFFDQPDWSILLKLLPRVLRDDAMLDQCEILPSVPDMRPASTARPARLDGYVVRLSGLASSPSAVSHIVVRLENCNLFDNVSLAQTSPHVLPAGEDGVAFQVICTIGTGEAEVLP